METAIEKYDICEIKYCTGCNICIQKCPKSCITFEENNLGVKYPKIDYSKCVKCNLCKQVCPSLNPVKKNETSNVFAAWSNDLNIRKKRRLEELHLHYINMQLIMVGMFVVANLITI